MAPRGGIDYSRFDHIGDEEEEEEEEHARGRDAISNAFSSALSRGYDAGYAAGLQAAEGDGGLGCNFNLPGVLGAAAHCSGEEEEDEDADADADAAEDEEGGEDEDEGDEEESEGDEEEEEVEARRSQGAPAPEPRFSLSGAFSRALRGAFGGAGGFLGSSGAAEAHSPRASSHGGPAFVKLAPGDFPELLHRVFWGHPRDFVPRADPKRGFAHSWGVVDDTEIAERTHEEYNMHMMRSNLYLGKDTPEVQFVRALAERKRASLEASRWCAEPRFGCDYTLRVALVVSQWDAREVVPPTWRRIRCSGGVTLAAFADKILQPAIGWARNYHAYIFSDRTDGAQFGPEKSDAIDMMHMRNTGFYAMDDAGVRLAEVLRAPGDKLNWLYDLGDGWAHVITLEHVAEPAASTGAAALLDGGGSCPPEDSNGLPAMGVRSGWDVLLPKAVAADAGDRAAARALAAARAGAAGALNYKGHEHRHSLAAYPLGFDLEEARARLAAALASRASTHAGAKRVVVPLGGGNVHEALTQFGVATGGAGTRAVARAEEDSPGVFVTETRRTGRDPAASALCDRCGSPANLKLCAKCKLVRYCSRDCQVAAWKAGHKQACARKSRTANLDE